MKCPICNTTEYIQFVFVLHKNEYDVVSTQNPSDDHWIYACPNWHIYGEDGNIIQAKED